MSMGRLFDSLSAIIKTPPMYATHHAKALEDMALRIWILREFPIRC